MATEDHDFEEIIILISKEKIQMEQESTGPVGGCLPKAYLMFLNYAQELGSSTNAKP
jgi:hypothetical protein